MKKMQRYASTSQIVRIAQRARSPDINQQGLVTVKAVRWQDEGYSLRHLGGSRGFQISNRVPTSGAIYSSGGRRLLPGYLGSALTKASKMEYFQEVAATLEILEVCVRIDIAWANEAGRIPTTQCPTY